MKDKIMHKAHAIITSYPACFLMFGIACFQMYYVFTGTLSPWKGGGYGMFSTQDSPGSRFLIIEGITELDEHVLIKIDSSFMSKELNLPSRTLSLIKANPNAEVLQAIGTGLLDIDFVDRQTSRLAIREHLRGVNPELLMRLDRVTSPTRRTLVPVNIDIPGHISQDKESLRSLTLTVWIEKLHLNNKSIYYEQFVGPVELSR